MVSDDFRKKVLGYGLTTAQILYRMPDHPSLPQTYVWQNYDLFPKFPALKDFLSFWQEKLDGPLYSVIVAHSRLIKPAEFRAIDGVSGCIEKAWPKARDPLPSALYCAWQVGKQTLTPPATRVRTRPSAPFIVSLPFARPCLRNRTVAVTLVNTVGYYGEKDNDPKIRHFGCRGGTADRRGSGAGAKIL